MSEITHQFTCDSGNYAATVHEVCNLCSTTSRHIVQMSDWCPPDHRWVPTSSRCHTAATVALCLEEDSSSSERERKRSELIGCGKHHQSHESRKNGHPRLTKNNAAHTQERKVCKRIIIGETHVSLHDRTDLSPFSSSITQHLHSPYQDIYSIKQPYFRELGSGIWTQNNVTDLSLPGHYLLHTQHCNEQMIKEQEWCDGVARERSQGRWNEQVSSSMEQECTKQISCQTGHQFSSHRCWSLINKQKKRKKVFTYALSSSLVGVNKKPD